MGNEYSRLPNYNILYQDFISFVRLFWCEYFQVINYLNYSWYLARQLVCNVHNINYMNIPLLVEY